MGTKKSKGRTLAEVFGDEEAPLPPPEPDPMLEELQRLRAEVASVRKDLGEARTDAVARRDERDKLQRENKRLKRIVSGLAAALTAAIEEDVPFPFGR